MINKNAVSSLLKEEESENYYLIEFENGQGFIGKILKRRHIAGTVKHYSLINANRSVCIFSYGDRIVRFEEV